MFRSLGTSLCIPGALPFPGPFQDFQLAVCCSNSTITLVHWTAIFIKPFQDLHVAFCGSNSENAVTPRTIICSSPFQDLQMATLGRTRTGTFIPWTTILSCPLQNLQFPVRSNPSNKLLFSPVTDPALSAAEFPIHFGCRNGIDDGTIACTCTLGCLVNLVKAMVDRCHVYKRLGEICKDTFQTVIMVEYCGKGIHNCCRVIDEAENA